MKKQNTPIVTDIFTADPSAHVFNDRIYIYPSHDIPHDGEDNDNGDEYQIVYRGDVDTNHGTFDY